MNWWHHAILILKHNFVPTCLVNYWIEIVFLRKTCSRRFHWKKWRSDSIQPLWSEEAINCFKISGKSWIWLVNGRGRIRWGRSKTTFVSFNEKKLQKLLSYWKHTFIFMNLYCICIITDTYSIWFSFYHQSRMDTKSWRLNVYKPVAGKIIQYNSCFTFSWAENDNEFV